MEEPGQKGRMLSDRKLRLLYYICRGMETLFCPERKQRLFDVSLQIFAHCKNAKKGLEQLAGQQAVEIALDAKHRNEPEDKEEPQAKAGYAEKESGGSFPKPV